MKDSTIFGALKPELANAVVSRRGAVTRTGKLAGAVAVASMPAALGMFTRKAFAQIPGLPADIVTVLNFALTLEYLESEFFQTGLDTAGLIPDTDLPIFETIAAHEAAHVLLLQGVLGTSAVPKPTFDFTAGGVFNPFADYEIFKALSQGFEDTGVRAYKGQAPALMADNDILTTALQIHSVEARHASAIRRLRGQKGWITGNQTDVPQLLPIYAGEEAANGSAISAAAAEAFDEPLTMDQVNAIAALFIAA
jgi:ferritin-like protein